VTIDVNARQQSHLIESYKIIVFRINQACKTFTAGCGGLVVRIVEYVEKSCLYPARVYNFF